MERSKPVRITIDRLPLMWRRLLWFVALWAASVLSITVVAGALHWLLDP